MFTTIHTLRSYSSALPNRGADGLAKRAIFGGVERQRISSQSLKAALRGASLTRITPKGVIDDSLPMIANELKLGLAHRSRAIFPRIVKPLLIERGMAEEAAVSWAGALAGLFITGDQAPEGGVLEQPIVLGAQECAALVDIAVRLADEGVKPVRSEILKAAKKLTPALEALQNPANVGVDGALFGRMSTADMIANVDSAVHVAHQISTHPIQSVADFFTVRDTLVTENKGGSHMNTSELVSGIMYGCIVVDQRQLERNFVELSPGQRGDLVAWLVRAVARVEPAAKRGSTAPYGAVHELVVELSDLQPRSAAAAFETPTEPTGAAAAAVMRAYLEQMDVRFGAPEHRLWLSDLDAEAGRLKQPGLELLSDKVGKIITDGGVDGRKAA